jgi:SAM-dependent methyltransferase
VPLGIEPGLAEDVDRLAGRTDHPDRLGERLLADRRDRQASFAHGGGEVVGEVDVDLWAQSFGSDAERYDRARPRYPDVMVERILAASPGADVVDVGCGTGIAARQLEAAGARVLGVEVDARMADGARRRGLEVEVAAFETWDPAGRTFDAVAAGQAWHWIDPLAGAVKAGQLDDLMTGVAAAIDATGGRFTMHYTTVVVTAVRS